MPDLQLDALLIDLLRAWHPSSPLPAELQHLPAQSEWQRLLTPLGEMPPKQDPEISLPLLDTTRGLGASQAGWDWSASVGASARLSVDVLDDAALAPLGIARPAGRILVQVGADLDLAAGPSGQAAFGAWGHASAALSAKGGAALHWLVSGTPDMPLMDVLVGSARCWRLPNDFTGLLALAGSPDFHGLRLDLTGQLQAQLSAGASPGWTGWQVALDGSQAEVGLHVGIEASVRFQGQAEFSLQVRPEQRHGRWGLRVDLDVLDAQSDRFALSLGSSLDLSAWTASAERTLRAAWPAVDPEWLTALTQPGTALGERLKDLVERQLADTDLRQLALVALGDADPATARAAWVQRLAHPLTDALDAALDRFAGRTATAEDLLQQWLRRLPGTPTLADALRADLLALAQEALTLATAQWQARVAALQAALTGASGQAVDRALQPLGALGERITQELARLDGAVPEAIPRALTAYAQARTRLLAALSDAKKARLGLTLVEQFQRSASRSQAVSGWFSGQGDLAAAQRLYQALCSGHLALLGERVDAAQASQAFELDAGWLASTARELKTQSAVLTLFGSDLAQTRSSLLDMSFKADLWGRLLAARADASVQDSTTNPWLARTVSLGVAARLDRRAGSPQLSLSLNGAFTARGRRMDAQAVQQLVESYARLCGTRPPHDVGDLLGAPRSLAAAKAFWRELTIAVPVQLDAPAWQRFETQPRSAVVDAFLRRGLQCLDDTLADRGAFRFTAPSVVLQDKADEFYSGDTELGRVRAYLGEFKAVFVSPQDPDIAYASELGFPDLTHTGEPSAENLQFTVLHRFAGVLRAAEALHANAPALRAALLGPEGEAPDTLRERARPPLAAMRDALDAVAVASQTLSGFGEDLSWPFATFLLAMAELTDRLPPGFLMVAEPPGGQALVPLAAD